jgi:hypothetical protein
MACAAGKTAKQVSSGRRSKDTHFVFIGAMLCQKSRWFVNAIHRKRGSLFPGQEIQSAYHGVCSERPASLLSAITTRIVGAEIRLVLRFEISSLKFGWDLGFGIWKILTHDYRASSES